MPFQIIRNDITKVKADAIINTANPKVHAGSGTDEAIYEAAGREALLEARERIGELEPGQAAATPAFALDAKYIIHTVGPVWQGGGSGEREILASCYRNALEIADRLGCGSAACPLISAGNYGFPKEEALQTALAAIRAFLEDHEMQVTLVVYDPESFRISEERFGEIESYITDREVKKRLTRRTRRRTGFWNRYELPASDAAGPEEPETTAAKEPMAPMSGTFPRPLGSLMASRAEEPEEEDELSLPDAAGSADIGSEDEKVLYSSVLKAPRPGSRPKAKGAVPKHGTPLKEILLKRQPTFQEHLLRLIDRKGLTDPEVYKRANLDRKLFSKIRSNPNYVPSKKTAVALALALELNLDQTQDLLLRAGLALSPSSESDLLIAYCIEHEIFDLYEVNSLLFRYDQPQLGA